MFKKTREDDKPRIKLKVNRPSGTYRQGEIVEGKILVAGIKKKLNVLSVNVIGAYVPSSSKKAIEAVPGLAKISKSPIFEFEKILVNEYVVSGSIKKTFSFELDRKGDRPFFETYYGFLFAVKVVASDEVRRSCDCEARRKHPGNCKGGDPGPELQQDAHGANSDEHSVRIPGRC